MLINELQYNPPQSGTDTAYEWFELYNTRGETIELTGWQVRDNGGYDVIPSMNISARGFMIIAAADNFSINFPEYSGAIKYLADGRIGNGLGNEGDCLVLTDSSGDVIDELSYGSDDTVNGSWLKKVGEGHSMERQPASGDFIDNANPTPGRGLPPATPVAASTSTPVPSHTPSVSPTPTSAASLNSTNMPLGTVANRSAILINEVQNNPLQSGSDSIWEWLELYNPGVEAIEIRGWGIADNHETDEIPYLNLSPGGLAVVAASENFSANFPDYEGTVVFIADGRIGNGLGNGGDRLILKDSAGTTIDELCYGDDDSMISPKFTEVTDGHSLERKPCGGQFIDNNISTPGHCLPEAIAYNESADLLPIPPMSEEGDSVSVKLGQSAGSSLPAVRTERASLSTGQQIEQSDTSLKPLLITLASTFLVIFGWMFYRRKAG